MIFTFTMTNGSVIVKTALIPKKILWIDSLVEDRFEMLHEGDEPYTLKIHVTYSDYTTGTLTVTPDMISGDLDFYNAGTYYISITKGTAWKSFTITVYDPDNPTVENMYIETQYVRIWKLSDVEAGDYNFDYIFWVTIYSNGTREESALMPYEIISPLPTTPGYHNITATRSDYVDTFEVYICEDYSEFDGLSCYISLFSTPLCEVGKEVDFKKAHIVLWGNLDERFIYLELPLSEELLEGFDKNTSGKQDCIVRLNGTIVGNIEIIVYTSAEFDREIYTQHWAYEIGEPISLILKEVIRYKYSGQEGDEEYTEELATSLLDLSEVTIVSGNADFTTTGEKIFRIEYYGKQYEISLKIFDPDITVIDLVIIYNFNDPIIPLGADVGEIIAELLVGKEAYASYYMMIDENWGENFTVTADMIDWSQVDGEVEGFYYITLTYKGYVKEIEVIIMGMAEGDPIAIYTGFCSAFPETFHKMELYPNGYALLYMSPDDGISYWLIPISVAYEQEGATMTLKIFGEPLCILTIDEEAGTFEPYNLDGEELYAIYTADAGEEGILTVYAYENGFGYFEMGGMPVYFGYHIEDDKFILHPTYVGIVFRIEGDTLVPYDE